MSHRLIVPSTWKIPPEITTRLGSEAGRQRLMDHEGHLLLILHRLPEADSNEREPVLFWRQPDGKWETNEKGQGLPALKKHVESYEAAAEALDLRLDTTRDADGLFRILSAAAPLARSAKNLHQVLQALREVTGNETEIITLRDEAYSIERTVDLLRVEAKNALDFDIARRAEEQAAQSREISTAAHRLNLMAAIFLPITAIASILGVNMHTGFEEFPTYVYWLLMGFSLFLGFVLLLIIQRKSAS
ncbi:MAG: CorA family divalent cation transporter [Limisphaerales bacterium]